MARLRGVSTGLIAGLLFSGVTSSCFAGWAGFTKASLFAGKRDTRPLFHSSGFLFHVHGFVARLAQQCDLCLDVTARLSEFAR